MSSKRKIKSEWDSSGVESSRLTLLSDLIQAADGSPKSLPGEAKYQSRAIFTYVLSLGLIGDLLVSFLSLMLSSWLRFETGLNQFGYNVDDVHWTDYTGLAAFGSLLFVILLPHEKMYNIHHMRSLKWAASGIFYTALRWLFAYLTFTWLFRSSLEMSRVYVSIAFIVSTSSLIGWRAFVVHVLNGKMLSSHIKQRVVFVGWSPQASKLAQAILCDKAHPYSIIGYIPTKKTDDNDSCPPQLYAPTIDASVIISVLEEHDVDAVILVDIDTPADKARDLAHFCEKEMIEFKVIPDYFRILLSGLRLQMVSGVPVLGISYSPLDKPVNVLLKQLTDFVGGLIGLLLSLPLIGFFGLWVYLENPGPVIFRQKRIGRDGKPFWILKIRSMKLDAEKNGKAGWTTEGDPRRLRIGAFMRKWNIDELPQFINVITGDMSLVGPRPERPEWIHLLKEKIPHYNARHNIKPGITGWAQVNGLRGDTDLSERIRCDLHYMENWNLFLDIKIIMMTLTNRKNAC